MAKAPAPAAELPVVKVKLGSIEVRESLNPRGKVVDERVRQYVDFLKNGSNPPPPKLHSKGVLFAGYARLAAYKIFFESIDPLAWREREVDCVYVPGLPDPDTEADLFRTLAAADNLWNGEPVRRPVMGRLWLRLHDQTGPAVAERYRESLGVSREAATELLRVFRRIDEMAPETADDAPQKAEPENAEKDGAPPTRERPAPDARVPSDATIASLKFPRPIVKVACEKMREAIKFAKGDFTPAELSALGEVWLLLRPLFEGGKAKAG